MNYREINNRFQFTRENNFYFELIKIDYRNFQQFYVLFNRFRQKLRNDECIDDDYWNLFIQVINQYRYKCSLLPISFNSETSVSRDDDNDMIESIKNVAERYPDYDVIIKEIVILWNYLRSKNENPYAEKIVEICKRFKSEKVTLIYKDYKMETQDREFLLNICSNLSFKNLRQYKIQNEINDVTIFLGSRSWYENDLFTMPISKKIIFIGYNGIYRSKKEIPVFRSLLWNIQNEKNNNPITVLDTETNISLDENIRDQPDRIHDEIAMKILTKKLNIDHHYAEKTTCRKVNFKSNHICFLRNDEHDHTQQLLIIDGDDKKIKSTNIDKISVGDFVLLRMEGMGNEIVDEANKFLGKKYEELRGIQFEWKKLLKDHIKSFGINRLVNSLIKEGVNAYASKVNFWAYNERNIKTKNPDDFRKLLRILGKEDQFDYWFLCLKQIDNAHRKVQPKIRKILLNVIVKSELSKLYSEGFQEFSLPHTASKLGIFEVERIANEDSELPTAIMDQPIPVNMHNLI
mgnify:FL=1